MSSERMYIDFLEDMLDASQKIMQFIQGMTYEQFAQDGKTTYAPPLTTTSDLPLEALLITRRNQSPHSIVCLNDRATRRRSNQPIARN